MNFKSIEELIKYLKENNLYEETLKKTRIVRTIVRTILSHEASVIDPCETVGFKVDCTNDVEIYVDNKLIVNEKEYNYTYYDEYPQSKIIDDRILCSDEFDKYLKKNKDFLEAVLALNKIEGRELIHEKKEKKLRYRTEQPLSKNVDIKLICEVWENNDPSYCPYIYIITIDSKEVWREYSEWEIRVIGSSNGDVLMSRNECDGSWSTHLIIEYSSGYVKLLLPGDPDTCICRKKINSNSEDVNKDEDNSVILINEVIISEQPSIRLVYDIIQDESVSSGKRFDYTLIIDSKEVWKKSCYRTINVKKNDYGYELSVFPVDYLNKNNPDKYLLDIQIDNKVISLFEEKKCIYVDDKRTILEKIQEKFDIIVNYINENDACFISVALAPVIITAGILIGGCVYLVNDQQAMLEMRENTRIVYEDQTFCMSDIFAVYNREDVWYCTRKLANIEEKEKTDIYVSGGRNRFLVNGGEYYYRDDIYDYYDIKTGDKICQDHEENFYIERVDSLYSNDEIKKHEESNYHISLKDLESEKNIDELLSRNPMPRRK